MADRAKASPGHLYESSRETPRKSDLELGFGAGEAGSRLHSDFYFLNAQVTWHKGVLTIEPFSNFT